MKPKDIIILLAIAFIAVMLSYGLLAAAWGPSIEYSHPPPIEYREKAEREHFRRQVLLSLIPLVLGATTILFYVRLMQKRRSRPPNKDNPAEDR